MRRFVRSALGAVAGTALFGLLALPPATVRADDQPPDNTGTNTRDRQKNEPTATDQGHARPDREIAAKIRRAVVKDDSLSMTAHNVKIIVKDGKVTLKGPVRSEAERSTIEREATQVVGAGNVVNQLEVAPK